MIGINAFDQPDVEASKIVTRQLTEAFEKKARCLKKSRFSIRMALSCLLIRECGGADQGRASNAGKHNSRPYRSDPAGRLLWITGIHPDVSGVRRQLQEIRKQILESKQVATVLGFGPRFLHSTGQAYKGGPNSGVFLQITCDEASDLKVPGQKYTFGMVKAAQARGDFSVLADRKRRALRVHLGKNIGADLDRLRDLVAAGLAH